MNRGQHKSRLKYFLNRTIKQYSVLNYEIEENDISEEEYTDYMVRITNDRSNKETYEILRSNGTDIEILKGEDFYKTDGADFFACLFIGEFTQQVES